MNTEVDVIVIGAGIIGVSCALHLQRRGQRVALVDTHGIGQEASSGNAGMLIRAGVRPYTFPFNPMLLARSITKNFGGFNYHVRYLLKTLPWLSHYAWNSRPASVGKIVTDMLPLIESCIAEHQTLSRDARVEHLLSHAGWLAVYRSKRSLHNAITTAKNLESYGLSYSVHDTADLEATYPIKTAKLSGGIFWEDPYSCRNPEALVKAYGELFMQEGGHFIQGDGRTLHSERNTWVLSTASGPVRGQEVVLATGAWTNEVCAHLGYRFPMADKRGYHMHYHTMLPESFHTPVTDVNHGYVLAPMEKGLRLTTGVELASRSAPYTPRQLKRLEHYANDIVTLQDRLDARPWIGVRPCLADMRPVIGPASDHRGLWFCFGHNHVGFATGPGSGRLLAQLMTGEQTFMDPSPFCATRFATTRC